MSEHEEQCAVVRWFKIQYPKYADCVLSIPNGSHLAGSTIQRAKKMQRMKKEGLKIGASDLFFAIPTGRFHGLWLEMKDEGKTKDSVSVPQWEHITLMIQMGYEAKWAAGFNESREIIESYMRQT